MLFVVFLIGFVIGIVLVCYDRYDVDIYEIVSGIGAGAIVVGGLGIFISLTFIICNYVGLDGDVAQYRARREVLVYQLENNVYENDNDIGKRELMTDIQEWNEKIARRKADHDDFWIGIYIPDVYDQFELIELR